MSQNPPSLKEVEAMAPSYDPKKTESAIKQHTNKSWFDDFRTLYAMMEDREFKVQNVSKVAIGGALAYVVLPADVIPDFIPIVGWLDDALVLKLVMDSARGEIAGYRSFLAKAA